MRRGGGGLEVMGREARNLREKGPSRISPFFIPATIINLASGYISIRSGAKGPNSATATACTTSAHSIGDSFKIIQRGDADVMICGGTEACITPMGIGGFAAMRAMSQRNDDPIHASRPFDRDRDGFVVGEGAGILILEELEIAKRRGAWRFRVLRGSECPRLLPRRSRPDRGRKASTHGSGRHCAGTSRAWRRSRQYPWE